MCGSNGDRGKQMKHFGKRILFFPGGKKDLKIFFADARAFRVNELFGSPGKLMITRIYQSAVSLYSSAFQRIRFCFIPHSWPHEGDEKLVPGSSQSTCRRKM
jgi:hypothetical protein